MAWPWRAAFMSATAEPWHGSGDRRPAIAALPADAAMSGSRGSTPERASPVRTSREDRAPQVSPRAKRRGSGQGRVGLILAKRTQKWHKSHTEPAYQPCLNQFMPECD